MRIAKTPRGLARQIERLLRDIEEGIAALAVDEPSLAPLCREAAVSTIRDIEPLIEELHRQADEGLRRPDARRLSELGDRLAG
jgi:hypothetical protein